MAIQGISMSDAAWYSKLNSNFSLLFQKPYPVKTYADVGTLTAAKPPTLYKHCLAVIGSIIYISDGTSWVVFRPHLTYVADLDTGTATITDIKNAFNGLLADMRTKKWLAV